MSPHSRADPISFRNSSARKKHDDQQVATAVDILTPSVNPIKAQTEELKTPTKQFDIPTL